MFEVYKGLSTHVGLCLYLFSSLQSKEVLCGFSYLCSYKLILALCWFYYVRGYFFLRVTSVTLVLGKCQGLVRFSEFTRYSSKYISPALKGRDPL